MKRLFLVLLAAFSFVGATRCAEPATELQARVALALASAGTTPTVTPAAPVTPPVDLSMYAWKQLDEEQAALLRDGKQVGTLWFESGKYHAFDGKSWSKVATEPPITRCVCKHRPAGAVCTGGCGPACGCPATKGASSHGCPCAPQHKLYPPISFVPPATNYTATSSCST
jgi:hypothetical protein